MGKKQREKFKVFPNSFPSVTKDGVYPVEFLGCADFDFENVRNFSRNFRTNICPDENLTKILGKNTFVE